MNKRIIIQLSGKVIHGDNLGKVLGFPTANLDRRDFVKQRKKVKFGVWAGEAIVNLKDQRTKVYRAGVVVGPLDKKGLPKLEAHLIGFKGNLYGQKLKVSLKRYLRAFRKYASTAELRTQIEKDIQKIKNIL